jgi:hypothetical protein
MRFLQMLGLESLDQMPAPSGDSSQPLEVVRTEPPLPAVPVEEEPSRND